MEIFGWILIILLVILIAAFELERREELKTFNWIKKMRDNMGTSPKKWKHYKRKSYPE